MQRACTDLCIRHRIDNMSIVWLEFGEACMMLFHSLVDYKAREFKRVKWHSKVSIKRQQVEHYPKISGRCLANFTIN